MHSLALWRFLLHFLFVLLRGCWAAELSCYHDTFSVWSDTSHGSLDTTSRQESKLNINKEFNKKQLSGLRCQVSRASIITWVSLIMSQLHLQPVSHRSEQWIVVWLLIKIKPLQSSVCLQSQNTAELYLLPQTSD